MVGAAGADVGRVALAGRPVARLFRE
ncbi:hypothetical protein STRTUCAR8_06632, partial [Streptomyces turgidiscabies Car8]